MNTLLRLAALAVLLCVGRGVCAQTSGPTLSGDAAAIKAADPIAIVVGPGEFLLHYQDDGW
jgi:hypothetical protein